MHRKKSDQKKLNAFHSFIIMRIVIILKAQQLDITDLAKFSRHLVDKNHITHIFRGMFT